MVKYYYFAEDLDEWRAQARRLLAHGVTPMEVTWENENQIQLFSYTQLADIPVAPFTISTEFLRLAECVACHRSPKRWQLLYQLLYRIRSGENHIMRITTDPTMQALLLMEKAIHRDSHKMKAFVRFRLIEEGDQEHYIAWHRPDHRVVPRVAPFFARRFETMRWTILTPDTSVHWDGKALHYSAGVDQSEAPQEDALESLWRDYYRATFNPARIKINAMKREMPVRHWQTLPETSIIADMLAEAPSRVEAMLKYQQPTLPTAADFLPVEQDINALRKAASACKGCELSQCGTQTVFGDGPTNAELMLVGEQPGDHEDRLGQPFVGPAGELLHAALLEADIKRESIYITNAVKHFRFLYKDSFRQHQSPSRYHIQACKPWLTAEISAIKPKAILCLGNTAGRALIHPNFSLKTHGKTWFGSEPRMFATYHPAAILRASGAEQHNMKQQLVEDIRIVADTLQPHFV